MLVGSCRSCRSPSTFFASVRHSIKACKAKKRHGLHRTLRFNGSVSLLWSKENVSSYENFETIHALSSTRHNHLDKRKRKFVWCGMVCVLFSVFRVNSSSTF